jgi:hypothetical protein
LIALAAPFEPRNDGRRCRWGIDAMKAMQVALWAASSDAILIAMQFFRLQSVRLF